MFLFLGAPQFTVRPPLRVNSFVGDSVRLNFKVTGTPKPKVTWYRDGEPIWASDGYVDFFDDHIVVKDLIIEDRGMYQARASNDAGGTEFSLEVLVLPKGAATPSPLPTDALLPDQPQKLVITGKSDSTISLAWQPPLMTNGPITSYLIEYKLQGATPRKFSGRNNFLPYIL